MDIEVNFGNSCNMNCSYCFVKNFKTDKNIEYNYISKIVGWLNDNDVKINNFRPVGGEPSLKLDNIIKFIRELKYKPKHMTFVTNGVNLIQTVNKLSRIIEYIKSITIVVSIDKLGYDDNRGMNYDNVMIDVINCVEMFNDIKFSINRVISDQTEMEINNLNKIASVFNISIMDIPETDEWHNINEDIDNVNKLQIKLCGGFCYNGLYFYKDSIYLCKLCENVHNIGLLGNINSNLDSVIDSRNALLNTSKINGCVYEKFNKEVNIYASGKRI